MVLLALTSQPVPNVTAVPAGPPPAALGVRMRGDAPKPDLANQTAVAQLQRVAVAARGGRAKKASTTTAENAQAGDKKWLLLLLLLLIPIAARPETKKALRSLNPCLPDEQGPPKPAPKRTTVKTLGAQHDLYASASAAAVQSAGSSSAAASLLQQSPAAMAASLEAAVSGSRKTDDESPPILCANPRTTVANHALTLVGKFQWGLPAMAEGVAPNSLEAWSKNKQGVEIFPVHGNPQHTRINCWEAVMVTAIDAGVLDKDLAKKALNYATQSELDYNDLVSDWFNPADATSIKDSPPVAGDVLLFYGGAHVALSLGGEDVMSLWYGPDEDDSFQKTTIASIGQLVNKNDCIKLNSIMHVMFHACEATAYAPFCDNLDEAENVLYDIKEEYCDKNKRVPPKSKMLLRKYGAKLPVLKLNPWNHIQGKLAGK